MKSKKIVRITYDCSYGSVQYEYGSECLAEEDTNRGKLLRAKNRLRENLQQ